VSIWHRTPLAWFNLTAERRRFLTAMGGVSFAVVLMFLFSGFKNGLYDSQVQLHTVLNGDVFVINRIKQNMFVPEQFARNRLYEAQAFTGVEAAYPLYIEATGSWKNPETGKSRTLRVLAFNLNDPVLMLPEILEQRDELQLPETASIDTRVRAEVGPAEAGIETELSDRRIRTVGTFTLGTDFAAGNGNLVMSDQNFLRYFANRGPEKDTRSLSTVDVGLLKVTPGTNLSALVKALREGLPNDVTILTREEFIAREIEYWQTNTSIGFVFSLLTAMAFAVGIILVYQILYTDIADHWAEYATLKAMGYTNLYLLGVVFQEAVLLSFLGYVPGFIASLGLYSLTANATGLLVTMNLERATGMAIATFIMCLISGAIAVRKVLATNPAEVFG
jgi:putative ABC transport system permease protein